MVKSDGLGVKVVIADKSPLVQAGLGSLIENDARFNLLATLCNGEDFLEIMERMEFDVGIIGWDMPGLGGRGVLQAVRAHENPPRIVIYTGNMSPNIPRLALQMGGAGFSSKSEALTNLMDTVMAVAEGRMVFPFMDISNSAFDPFGNLTSREQELLAALSRGSTNSQIAKELDISLNTVKFHLKNLYGKLSVKNRAQAVSCYLKSHGSGHTASA